MTNESQAYKPFALSDHELIDEYEFKGTHPARRGAIGRELEKRGYQLLK